MKILFIVATRKEAGLFGQIPDLKKITGEAVMAGRHMAALRITGAGVPQTVYGTCEALTGERPDLVIHTGIAGSFQKRLQPGMLVCPCRDCFADLGVEVLGTFRTVQELKWEDSVGSPFEGHWLKPTPPVLPEGFVQAEQVTAITVNKVTDQASARSKLQSKFNADIETMEGAAAFYTCMKAGVPVWSLRAVSNYVGERDRSNWKFEKALDALAQNLELFVKKLKAQ